MKKMNIVVCFSAAIVAGTYLIFGDISRDSAPVPLNVSANFQKVELEPEFEPKLEAEPDIDARPAAMLYDAGTFGPDALRNEYISGEMVLNIPRIKFKGPVYSDARDITPGTPSYMGVSGDILLKGVALFGASQLPTESNSNVSIAGHRDIHGMEFYNIDKITQGDYIFLEFRDKEYVYLFEESFVTEDYDWNPIKTKDYGCITLQSCTPINVASHRIFVVGRLTDIRELNESESNNNNEP